jgi:hypothetical protein
MENESDRFAMQLLEGPNVQEARAWLQKAGPETTLGEEMFHEESVGFVEELYALGAQAVHAVEIAGQGTGFENTGKLVIELPDTAEERKAVLALCDEIAESMGFDPEPDIGQRYRFVMLD